MRTPLLMTPAPRSRPRFIVPLLILTALLHPVPGYAQAEKGTAAGESSTPAAETPEDGEGKKSATGGPDSSVEEILVSGTSVTDAVDQARFSESIVDVLSAEDFATTGDSSVVGALSRITGVTTVGDKYVYVRGLGERYSSTLFNNAMLPSPDPVRRVVPLDIFPSGVMDALTVQKTYSPNLPADFSGGSVQLTTRSVPPERELHFDITTKTNTRTTGKKTPWMDGGSADWTGFDNGFRRLPKSVRNLTGAETPEQQQAAGLALNRSWDVNTETLPPGVEMTGGYANSWKTHAGDVGIVLGAQGQNDWQYVKEKRASANSKTTVGNFSTLQETTNAVDYAALGSLNWTPAPSQRLKATMFWSHLTDNRYIQDDPSYSTEASRFDRYIRSEYEIQSLLTGQLTGSHEIDALGDLLLDWGLTYAQAKRELPDSRFYGYIYEGSEDIQDPYHLQPGEPDPDSLRFASAASNTREWEYLTDNAWDAVLNASLPLRLTDHIQSNIRAGTKYYNKQRDSSVLRYRYTTTVDHNQYDELPIDEIFADANINPNYWQLRGATRDSDQYTAEEEIIAGYLQSQTDLGEHFRLMVGTRFESSRQETETGGTVDPKSRLEDQAFFPAVELTWIVRDDLQLRAGWSQTVNRPDLRELSSAIFINPENRYSYFGNPNLTSADLTNYDLRLEWYHGTGDSLELAGFYKDITDPIQEIALPQGDFRTWRNGEQATLWGVEVAASQGLAPLGRWAEDFSVRTNAAYIQSEVTESPDAPITNHKHALQGQSEWVFNFQITHDYLPWDLKNTLALNVFGERIADVGSKPPDAIQGREDAYEQPAPSLDFVLRWGFELFRQDMGLTFKAKNLIDPKVEVTRGSVTERAYHDGRYFSLEIGYDF